MQEGRTIYFPAGGAGYALSGALLHDLVRNWDILYQLFRKAIWNGTLFLPLVLTLMDSFLMFRRHIYGLCYFQGWRPHGVSARNVPVPVLEGLQMRRVRFGPAGFSKVSHIDALR